MGVAEHNTFFMPIQDRDGVERRHSRWDQFADSCLASPRGLGAHTSEQANVRLRQRLIPTTPEPGRSSIRSNQRSASGDLGRTDLLQVFTSCRLVAATLVEDCSRAWRPFVARAGYAWVTFRNTVATLLDDTGLTARQIADILGHAHPSMTQDAYMGRGSVTRKGAAALDATLADRAE